MPTQCAYWDKFSVLENLTERQSSNLGKFLAHAFQLRCIPITMLKKFDFTQLGQDAPAAFFRSVMKEMAIICSAQGNHILNGLTLVDSNFNLLKMRRRQNSI